MLFDMAGTPIEDGSQVPAACGAVLAACGVSLSDDQLGNVRGASKREAIAELVARPGAPARCSLRRPASGLTDGSPAGRGRPGRGGRNRVDAAGGGKAV